MSSGGDDEQARFRAAMDLVDRMLDLPEDERQAVLRECTDGEVRAEVERLLAADASDASLLSRPAGQKLPSALSEVARSNAGAAPGHVVGPFRLVSLLGRGGMGEVWIAERVGADFEQRVALKLLHGGGEGEAAAARFRRERQILAKLAHPRIARLLDGGVTADGRPWLAMDLVRGLPLVDHCVARALDVDARLRLFVEVCDAVQFAHQNLVVHRDLKPSNILVDANGEPKLLDFGIAKLLEEDDESTALTAGDERPMTPDYASPEQVRGDVVTTASDVWTLGAILHELLTGARPHRAPRKEGATRDAVTTRPSATIVAGADGKTTERRPAGLSPIALRRRLEGDLDAIVLKAMRPEPHERYGSVDALADDVRRHLVGAPVAARGGATSYLLRATLRRHRIAVGVALVVVAALAIGLVGTLWQARRAREEAKKAEKAQEFLIGMLHAFDPLEEGGKDLSQRDILMRGEARVAGDLGDQPEVQARLLRAFAETWYGLGEPKRAQSLAERALEIQRRVLGRRHAEVALTLVILGEVSKEAATPPESIYALYAEAASIARETEGPGGGSTLARALGGMAMTKRQMGDLAEAERLFREALEIDRRIFGDEDNRTLVDMSNSANLLSTEGKFAEAAALEERMVVLFTKTRGEDFLNGLRVRRNLGRDLVELGRFAEAEALLRGLVAKLTALFGERSVHLAPALRELARALDGLGRWPEAFATFDRAVDLSTEHEGPKSPFLTMDLWGKAEALRHAGKAADAEALVRRALGIRVTSGRDDVNAARMRITLGASIIDQGRADEARGELSNALVYLEKSVPSHPAIAAARAELARAGSSPTK